MEVEKIFKDTNVKVVIISFKVKDKYLDWLAN
jgi:hypothetical protein